MPGVFRCKKGDCASFEYCDDFDLKTQLFKPKDITHNGLRIGDGRAFYYQRSMLALMYKKGQKYNEALPPCYC